MNKVNFIQKKLVEKYNNIKKENTNNVKIETEFRFTLFSKYRKYNVPSSGVDIATYLRIKNHYSNTINRKTTSVSTNYTQNIGNIRFRKTIENNKVSWLKKERDYLDYLLNDYYVQIAINTETDIEEVQSFKPDNIRIKDRTSFFFKTGVTDIARLDITYVESDMTKLKLEFKNQNMSDKDIKDKLSNVVLSSYEIEFEILDYNANSIIEKELNNLYKIVHDTNHIYNQKQYEAIVLYINKTLNPKMSEEKAKRLIGTRNFLKARNLNYKDMVWGGLIGNETYHYRITIKADGYRKLLVFHQSGIWIVGGDSEVNLVILSSVDYLNGYILEGESIPEENRRDTSILSKFIYYAFDVLSTKPHNKKLLDGEPGDVSIQNSPHNTRMMHVYNVVVKKYNVNNTLAVYGKKFHDFFTTSQFFDIVRQLDTMSKVYPFEDDGFIIIPDEMPYNKFKQIRPDLTLTKYPNICKWKPLEKLTIDFSIKPEFGNTEVSLYVVDREKYTKYDGYIGERNILVKFKIFPKVVIEGENLQLKDLPAKTIVEFKWDGSKFIFVKVRPDKDYPNSVSTSNDTWRRIHDSITIDTMKGKSLKLMRKYHNRIKRSMINKLDWATSLLDIGSGRGGDIGKFSGTKDINLHLKKIIAVEPVQDHIDEYINRLKEEYMKNPNSPTAQQYVEVINDGSEVRLKVKIALDRGDKFILIKTGGENTSLITQVVKAFVGGPVDVVISMLSLSFFWLYSESITNRHNLLDDLINTIRSNLSKNGVFYYLTIDGDLLQEFMKPTFGGQLIDTINLFDGDAIIKYNHIGKEVKIYLKDTIVKGVSDVVTQSVDQTKNQENDTEVDKYGVLEINYQTEGLVRIDDLIRKLSPNYVHMDYYRADQEGILSTEGSLLSSFYSYGGFYPQDFDEFEKNKKIKKENIKNENTKKMKSQKMPIGDFVHMSPRSNIIFQDKTSSVIHDIPMFATSLPQAPLPQDPIISTILLSQLPPSLPSQLPISPPPSLPSQLFLSPPTFPPSLPSQLFLSPPTFPPSLPSQLPLSPPPSLPSLSPPPSLPSLSPPPSLPSQLSLSPPPSLPSQLSLSPPPSLPSQLSLSPPPSLPSQLPLSPPPSLPSQLTTSQPLSSSHFTPFLPSQLPLSPPPFLPSQLTTSQPLSSLTSTQYQSTPFLPSQLTTLQSLSSLPSLIQSQQPLVAQFPISSQPTSVLPSEIPSTLIGTQVHVTTEGGINLPGVTPSLAPSIGYNPLQLSASSSIFVPVRENIIVSDGGLPAVVPSIPEVNKYDVKSNVVNSIKLLYNSREDVVYGDNKAERIIVPWYTEFNVDRISSSGPNTCFLECLMNAIDVNYTRETSYKNKQTRISQLKFDLQNALSISEPADEQSYGDKLQDKLGKSIDEIKNMIQREIGYDNELLNYISKILSIGITIMKIQESNLIYVRKSELDSVIMSRGIVILGKSKLRYELIGVNKGNMQIQTSVSNDDTIMVALNTVNTFNIIMNIVYQNIETYKGMEKWEDIKILIIELNDYMNEISKGINKTTEFNETYGKLYSYIA